MLKAPGGSLLLTSRWVDEETCGFAGTQQEKYGRDHGPDGDEGCGGCAGPGCVRGFFYGCGGDVGTVWDSEEGDEGDPEREPYAARVGQRAEEWDETALRERAPSEDDHDQQGQPCHQ